MLDAELIGVGKTKLQSTQRQVRVRVNSQCKIYPKRLLKWAVESTKFMSNWGRVALVTHIGAQTQKELTR